MALDTPQESVEKLDEQFLESISELCKTYYERTYDENFPRRSLPQNQELTLLLEEIRQTNNVNAVNKGGNTLLHLAARASEKEMVDILLSHPQIDVNIQNNQKMTPLMMVLTRGNDMDAVVKSLFAHPKIDLDIQNNMGITARKMAERYQVQGV